MRNFIIGGVVSVFMVLGLLGIIAMVAPDNDSVPVGTIVVWGGDVDTIPDGWKLCNGRSLSKNKFKELYGAIGKAWGGSGNKFNLPDLRGRFIRGVDSATGRDPDAMKREACNKGGNKTGVGSIQEDTVQEHSHYQSAHHHVYQRPVNSVYVEITTSGFQVYRNSTIAYLTSDDPAVIKGARRYSTKSNVRTGEENRPKNAAVFYIIKVE